MTAIVVPDHRRDAPDQQVGRALPWSAAVLAGGAFAAAVAGLAVDDVYTGAASTAAMFRGYDQVTATVVAPALGVAAWTLRAGRRTPPLVVTALAAYLAYTYAYYLFGTGFNDLFLLHVGVFAAALVTVVLGLHVIDAAGVAAWLRPRARPRASATVLGLLALALAGMWVWAALDNVVTGAVPAGSVLVETETIVRLGIALDLAVLLPLYLAAAVLLWRGASWGFALAAVALLSGLLHQVGYLVALPAQVAAGVPGAVGFDVGEPVVVLVYLLATGLLVAGRRADSRR